MACQAADTVPVGHASVAHCTSFEDVLSVLLDGNLADGSTPRHRGWVLARLLAWSGAQQVCALTESQRQRLDAYDADLQVTVSVSIKDKHGSAGQRFNIRTVCHLLTVHVPAVLCVVSFSPKLLGCGLTHVRHWLRGTQGT